MPNFTKNNKFKYQPDDILEISQELMFEHDGAINIP